MKNSIRLKLFLMMVLEYFIWGAWLPLIFSYLPSLKFTAVEQSWILNAFPIAAFVGIFFSNQFVDRNFSAEKFLAFSQFVGGVAMMGLALTKSFWPFFGLMLLHCLLYVPTLSITNSIAFSNLKDPQKEFGLVRMGGDVGWVLAAWPFTFILVDWDKVRAANAQGIVNWISTALNSGLTGEALHAGARWTFVVAGVASLLLAAFSFSLPHTPPHAANKNGAENFAWLEAVKLLRHPFVLILWLVTLVDTFVNNCYFNWAGTFLGTATVSGGAGIPGNWIMPVMSIGQITEMLAMFMLGSVLKRAGWRATMILGILAYPVRFAVWAFFPQSTGLIIIVQTLHGVCYAFFFATVYIFANEYFPKDARASAQGLFNVMILGIGVLAANSICPYLIQNDFIRNGVVDFRSLFLVPLAAAIVAAVSLALFFRPPRPANA